MQIENNFPLIKSPEISMGIFASGNGTRNPVSPVLNKVSCLLLKKEILHNCCMTVFPPFFPSMSSRLELSEVGTWRTRRFLNKGQKYDSTPKTYQGTLG